MRNKVVGFFENLVIIAILLVLIQTFMEDFAVLAGWSWDARKVLILTGFFFDLFFTIEFLTRLYYAIFNGSVGEYLFQKKGWIDFLASVPLLMLNSGPSALALLAGGTFLGMGGFLNVLKVVKAIRIARILRLLRILKIFKQIKYADSRMAQRHIAKISAISISIVVFTLFIFVIFTNIFNFPSDEKIIEESFSRASTVFSETYEDSADSEEELDRFTAYYDDVLIIKEDGASIYSKYDNSHYGKFYGSGDYKFIEEGRYQFYYDIKDILKLQSLNNLLYFGLVLMIVLAFMFYYSPHFAITVSDPIHVMRRGMEEGSYNLEVRVPREFEDDDIFLLASMYNSNFLPMKVRSSMEDNAGMLDLKMDDIKDIFEEE